MSSQNAIVIAQPWGGLGDNLQFSTLPELYAQLGFDVYISSANAYRNPEIYDLVWKHNPYVKGVADLPANAGSCMFGGEAPTADYMTNIELGHGLTHGYRKYPVIYYTPTIVSELADVLLYDTTSITQAPSEESVRASFESVFSKHPGVPIHRLEFSKIGNRPVRGLEHKAYKINSIYDLCDAIYSCKIFLSLHAGSAVLASAVKENRANPLIYTILPSHIQPPQYMFANAIYLPYC